MKYVFETAKELNLSVSALQKRARELGWKVGAQTSEIDPETEQALIEGRANPNPQAVRRPKLTEESLVARYPNVRIVEGSLTMLEDERKQAVRIVCATEGCNAERQVRTSDLFQVTRCELCTLRARAEARKSR
jgi:hypothetical protein